MQLSLFQQFPAEDESAITLDEAALLLHVSPATIRNWVKAGYLELLPNHKITANSIDKFKDGMAGTEKLISRANKSLKDTHNNDQLSQQIAGLLAKNELTGSDLAQIYEQSLSESHKNKEGIYYTPHKIVNQFFNDLPHDCTSLTFCDPCCGTGNFLVAAIAHGFPPENIYGFDVDATAIQIARKRIHELTGIDNHAQIRVADFLEIQSQAQPTYVDVILTNPPWGKKVNQQQRDFFSKRLHTGGAKDSSALFFFACLRALHPNGYLGLLLQEAFFNIATFEPARKAALEYKINTLIDFGKPFKGLVTKASGIILQKSKKTNPHVIHCFVNEHQYTRTQESFQQNPKSIINFCISDTDSTVITHLNSLKHVTLAGYAKYGLGIVTGNNAKFCSTQPQTGYLPVYRGSDIQRGAMKEASTFIMEDMSLFQQVAPLELYQAKEKLIYKFISSDLLFFLDTKQRLILNSANMLVLNDDFPITSTQLCQILNSRIMSWYFRAVFNTHKVLQADLELLPIHVEYFTHFNEFSEPNFHTFLGIVEVTDGTFRIKN